MTDSNEKRPLVQFEELNLVGKVVFATGTVFKMAETAFDFTLSTLGKAWNEAEKAFHEELRDTSNDAVIIEEFTDEKKK